MFAGVEFRNKSCAIVPIIWIVNNNSYWPNSASKNEFRKLLESFSPPSQKWPQHPVKVHFTCESLEEAETRLNEVLELSSMSEHSTEESKLRNYFETEGHTVTMEDKVTPSAENENSLSKMGGTSPSSSDESLADQTIIAPKKRNIKVHKRKSTSSSDELSFNEDFHVLGTTSKGKTLMNNLEMSKKHVRSSEVEKDHEKHGKRNTESNDHSSSCTSMSSSTRGIVEISALSRGHQPNYSPASSRSENRYSGAFEEKVIKLLEKLIAEQEQMSIRVDQISRSIADKSVKNLVRPEDLPKFPLEGKKDFKQLERLLISDKSVHVYLKNRLAAVGGPTVRATTMNIMKFLMTNKLATKFNWAGNNDKKAFKKTSLMEVIKEALYKSLSSDFKPSDLNDLTIVKAVQDWLRLSAQRLSYKENKLKLCQ